MPESKITVQYLNRGPSGLAVAKKMPNKNINRLKIIPGTNCILDSHPGCRNRTPSYILYPARRTGRNSAFSKTITARDNTVSARQRPRGNRR